MDTAARPRPFDRTREDAGNIVALEHVNVQIGDQQRATAFYVLGLQLTRDPYLMVGLDNMWINAGRTQFHLPTSPSHPQRLRGVVGLVVPRLDAVERALERVARHLDGTRFAWRRGDGTIEATCPWGNRFRLHEPDATRWGQTELGIAYLELSVPPNAAAGIARFYRTLLDAPADVEAGAAGATVARVHAGGDQRLVFVETSEPLPPYDGHHIQIYLADFSGPYERLLARGLVSRETDEHEWRFVDIVDPESGALLFQLEHEVRSVRHPLYGRTMVNRNPAQTNRGYAKGQDAFRGSY
jgi:hypothetical protein